MPLENQTKMSSSQKVLDQQSKTGPFEIDTHVPHALPPSHHGWITYSIFKYFLGERKKVIDQGLSVITVTI